MIATLVIFMREGIEASMIVAILLAYLNRMGQRRYFRDVFIGVGAALALAAGGGIAAYLTIRQYDGSNVQTFFETGTYLLAAVVLTYMTFWMRGHARGLSGELRARADAALTRGARTGLALLAFQAVGREGLETVVFTLAIVFSTSTQGALLGAVIGLAISLAIAFFIYRLGHKLNLSRFFTVIGALLMFFAAGLLADAVENMQQLGWLNFLTRPLWHTGGLVSEGSTLGDIAHSFVGYADSPTLLQVLIYVGYLATVLFFFLRVGRHAKAPAAPASSASASSASASSASASSSPASSSPAS
jgi:high-affinity iron transporter